MDGRSNSRGNNNDNEGDSLISNGQPDNWTTGQLDNRTSGQLDKQLDNRTEDLLAWPAELNFNLFLQGLRMWVRGVGNWDRDRDRVLRHGHD